MYFIVYAIYILTMIITDLPSMTVLDKSGLKITFKLERPPDIADLLVINMSAHNSRSTSLTDFLFQAAVPRVRDIYYYITCVIIYYVSQLHCYHFLFSDIPITDVIAIEYCHSSSWSSNSSVENYKYE